MSTPQTEANKDGASSGLALATSSELFQRVMPKCDELMLKVWSGTPWMVEAYTGGCNSERWEEIADWCEAQYGREAWPIHGHPGKWHRGGATINGYTWLGFETQEMMQAFEARFPNIRRSDTSGGQS